MPTVAIIQPVNITEASIFFGASGYASDTEIEWTNANVTVYSDGTFSWLDGETSFTARSYNVTPSGSFTTFTLGIAPLTWPPSSLDYETTIIIATIKYYITQGKFYTFPDRTYVSDLYDYAYVTNNYKTNGAQTYYTVSSVNYPVERSIVDPFTTQSVFLDLIGPLKSWKSFTAQSPLAPSIPEYVALRAAILAGTSDFLDNRISIIPSGSGSGGSGGAGDESIFRSIFRKIYRPIERDISSRYGSSGGGSGGSGGGIGGNSTGILKFLAVAQTPSMVTAGYTSKCSLDNEWLFFYRGDTYSVSADFYIESGTPTGLLDVESSYLFQGPGMRVLLDTSLVPRVQFKFGDNPNYRQDGVPVPVPSGQWFTMEMQIYLSDTSAGLIRLYLNGNLIIDKEGRTLPTPDAVVTRLEIGITANSNPTDCITYVDNVNVSLIPPWKTNYRISSAGNQRISSTGNKRVHIK